MLQGWQPGFNLAQVDDSTGLVTRMVGFDERELTSKQGGKPAAIARLRNMHPYETVIMVGDGITDLEAVQITGGADAFIGACRRKFALCQ